MEKRPSNLSSEEPYPARQIPLDSFKPILTNNEAKIAKEKLLESKSGSVTVKGRKKKSRKDRIKESKERMRLRKLGKEQEEVIEQNQKVDVAYQFKPFDTDLEAILNAKLKS